MSKFIKVLISVFLCFTISFISLTSNTLPVKAASIEFVLLSKYKATVDIGDEFYILAFTTNGAMPTWKSSSSKIASVNTYGKVTAKKPGSATITAKIKNGEASCKVTVKKTKVTISATNISLERGETKTLSASVSNASLITWKSSKKSIATIDEAGVITAIKPGETTITATADTTSKTCKVKVKYPTILLSRKKIKLYRGQTARLTATVSSLVTPAFKTNKNSVATVDENGIITARKHGTAVITATVDGISRTCEVEVKKPKISLSSTELTLQTGTNATLIADVSSGNSALWSSSNSNIVTVDEAGTITAWQQGRAYIYATEDGTKVRCTVFVKEMK